MRFSAILFLLIFLTFSCRQSTVYNDSREISKSSVAVSDTSNFVIAIHGGAGTILKGQMSSEMETAYKTKLEEAVKAGHTILKEGGSSLDAVEKAINILEDSPLFNAGKGAVFTNDGKNELDASIMSGKDLNAGAVAGVTKIKNPISLARAVMEKSDHVMFAREGAEAFAKEQGFNFVDSTYFYSESRMESLKKVRKREKKEVNQDDQGLLDKPSEDSKFGTVGCVALDKNGNLAAGTSTGGMTNKRWGRIGDSPVIGAGTYANNNTCAVSSTGWGEYFIKGVVAYDISAMMEYKPVSLKEAATEVIQDKLPALGGDGGIIAIDKQGNIVMEFNTDGMYRASINKKGELYIGLYKN